METALLGLALPAVLQQLKEMLLRKGFLVQTMPASNPVIVAYQEGNWLRKPRQLVLEISPMGNNITRIDITATLEASKPMRQEEEIIEENFASSIYNTFKTVLNSHHENKRN